MNYESCEIHIFLIFNTFIIYHFIIYHFTFILYIYKRNYELYCYLKSFYSQFTKPFSIFESLVMKISICVINFLLLEREVFLKFV